MSRHLLLTAWAFPPARTSGVYRAAGIADAFVRAGWHVTVLTGPASLFRANEVADETLLETVDPRIEIVEVPLEHHELSTDITTWSRTRARQPELWTRRRLQRDRHEFPEAWYGSWAPALREAADAVHQSRPVDLALGTAAPYVDFVPGEHLRAQHGVPYILDYRDAWTFLTFTGTPPAGLTDAVRDRERALMSEAFQVWFVNDPIRGWHAGQYPDSAAKMRTVRNGFDLPAQATDAAAFGVPLRDVADGPLTFGYIGTINFGAFPLDEVVEAWRIARMQLPEGSRLVLRGHLGRTGEGSPQLMAALAEAEPLGIVYEGPVSRSRLTEVYRQFDALLLALPSGPGVTSGKVYEYAATGLPIVSVHTPETPVAEVLGDTDHWHAPRSLEPEAIAESLIDAARQVQLSTVGVRQRAIAAGLRWERLGILATAVADVETAFGVEARA
ncbi:glycosyltransferase [Microbacterium esteraromaticum]|uniref:glycosyltransferase n=1 Tax=Microbacterium esteraromaticum TaxID=57043 RepID=UPI001C9544A6|nr:glycosyltransferase [Microbacterium esteraromaticum]MBY6060665.1 glycosyltransferase [Microbacterium esteraromaticum]